MYGQEHWERERSLSVPIVMISLLNPHLGSLDTCPWKAPGCQRCEVFLSIFWNLEYIVYISVNSFFSGLDIEEQNG